MQENTDDFTDLSQPVFLEKTELLLKVLQNLDHDQLQKMWKCNEKLAVQNEARLKNMNLRASLTPALFAYKGLAFQHLSPGAMNQSQLSYVQEHLRILSGFYGVLKPFDGVKPYRLEMQSVVPGIGSLYEFWKDLLYQEVRDDVIVNLASKEYADCICRYDESHIVNIIFGELKDGKVMTKGTMAKMARGDMVYWMSEQEIVNVADLKRFDEGYEFACEYSDDKNFVFIKK